MRWEEPHNTDRIRSWLRRVKAVKTWQLLIILLIGAFVAATLLRLNNLGMADRRQAVVVADEKGDPAAVKHALLELQHYVSSHMNTSIQGVYLVKTYEKAKDAAVASASDASNPQSEVYKQASVECRSRFRGGVESFRNDYVTCVLERVSALSQASDPTGGVVLPQPEDYRYDYASPSWTPDATGFAVLFCVLVTGVIIGRLLTLLILHLMLRHRYRSL